MRIAIAGGSGFIGQALCRQLNKRGDEVIVISRRPGQPVYSRGQINRTQWPDQLEWSNQLEQKDQLKQKDQLERKDQLDQSDQSGALAVVSWDQVLREPDILGKPDAFINLAGATLNQRWTKRGKQTIIGSRLQTVSQTAELLRKLTHKPEVLIQGSAIGIYGTSLGETFDEGTETEASDFLSRVAVSWENAADSITKQERGMRLVKLRTGVVLGNEGGAYPLMKLPFLLGIGGKIGSGKQWLSWIHIEDMVSLILFCLQNPEIAGPINAVAPHPVTNEAFGRSLATVYRRPYGFPLPAFLLQTVLGERATLLLDGQRVLPHKALEAGFRFSFSELAPALQDLKNGKGKKVNQVN